MNTVAVAKETMNIKSKNHTIGAASIFYFAFAICLVSNLLFTSSTLEVFLGMETFIWSKIIGGFMYAILLIKIIFYQTYTLKQIAIITAITIILLLAYAYSGDRVLIISFFFIVAAKDINLERTAKIIINVQTIVIPIIILMALTGFIENKVLIRYDSAVLRYALGFGHPNNLGAQILQLCVCWMWLRWPKLRLKDYLMFALLGLFVSEVCDSRTSFYLIISLIIVIIAYKGFLRVGRENILNFGIKLSVLVCPLISLWFAVYYNSGSVIQEGLSSLFSHRIRLLHDYFDLYGFTVFGQKVIFTASNEVQINNVNAYILDNAYGHIAICFGIVALIIFVTGLYLSARKASHEKYAPILISMFIYSVYGLMESYIYILPYNFTLLALSAVLYSRRFDNITEESLQNCRKCSY